MKQLIAVAALAALAALAGCNPSPTGGSGGEETFKLSGPVMPTTVHQEKKETVTISVDRGKDFKEDVTLTSTTDVKDVTIDPKTTTVKAGDKDAKLTIAAGKDAPLGDAVIKVEGKPEKGKATTLDFKVKIEK